jgi:ribosome-binding protein aMBF1 (putative translation factor)
MGRFYQLLQAYFPAYSAPEKFYRSALEQEGGPFDEQDFRGSIDFVIENTGMSDADLARAMQVRTPSLQRWREGKNIPHPALRTPMVRFLGSMLERKIGDGYHQAGILPP